MRTFVAFLQVERYRADVTSSVLRPGIQRLTDVRMQMSILARRKCNKVLLWTCAKCLNNDDRKYCTNNKSIWRNSHRSWHCAVYTQVQRSWLRFYPHQIMARSKHNNALSLSVLPVFHLEGERWTTGSTRKNKDNSELEDNYARVSCCSGRGSDPERFKNFPNLPLSCMLFYSELEDNCTRGSCCPWVKNGTTEMGKADANHSNSANILKCQITSTERWAFFFGNVVEV